jgi:hypothetical protein
MGYLVYPGQPPLSGISMISLNFLLLDGLKSFTAYRVQGQSSYAAELKLKQLERDNKSQWDSSKIEFETAVATAIERVKTLKLSQKLYDTNLARFKQGRTSADELQVEQSRLIDSELLAIEGQTQMHLKFVGLCHSLGQSVKTCGK